MKKILLFFLITVLCVSLCGCGGIETLLKFQDTEAFEKSKSAYDSICIAYEITAQFSSDVYEAWRLGIYDVDEICDGGAEYLASELYLSEKQLCTGIAYYVTTEIIGDDWDKLSANDRQNLIDNADVFLFYMEEDMFSHCVNSVIYSYQTSGKTDEAQSALDEAKMLMKELSEDYSDYEHYPNLKGYYTTTKSFFEFCCDPEGSFEQVKDTINDYRNEARDYISDLDYIFEE